jgi:hypothetical protein
MGKDWFPALLFAALSEAPEGVQLTRAREQLKMLERSRTERI